MISEFNFIDKFIKTLYMKTTHFILAAIISFFSVNNFANGLVNDVNPKKTSDEIFTSLEKDNLQFWHYNQVLLMDITEGARDDYFSTLNSFTYRMSHLGLSKHEYSDAERKKEFDHLAKQLDYIMKNKLSPDNYIIHHNSFEKIEQIIYDRRNWKE